MNLVRRGSGMARGILLWSLLAFMILKVEKWITVGIGDSAFVPRALSIELPLWLLLWCRPGRLAAVSLVVFFSLATLISLISPALDCG